MDRSSEQQCLPEKQEYAVPTLREYGTVAAVTATRSKTGIRKDGGPNNIKS
jgi:hypothetical protein